MLRWQRAQCLHVADATPKSGEGEVEMIRMLKSTKNSAVKARTQTVNQMKALVVTAPAELREKLDGLGTSALVKRCRSFRPGRLDSPTAAAKYALVRLPVATVSSREIQDLKAELNDSYRPWHRRWSKRCGIRHGCGAAEPPVATPIVSTPKLPSHRCAG